MSELTLLVLQLGFLLLLWVFVFAIVYALRSDLFGQRVRKLQPEAASQSPATTWSCSSSISRRVGRSGNGKPKRRCSPSCQAAPRPSSTRPPLISAMLATSLATLPGWRNVTGETIVPCRSRSVTSTSPAIVAKASDVSWPDGPGKDS